MPSRLSSPFPPSVTAEPIGTAGSPGSIRVDLDGESIRLDSIPSNLVKQTRLDRFGIITTRIDGNGPRPLTKRLKKERVCRVV